jgi:sigma-B regulation protein RsbU (phosphoserine phosphatase)
MDRSERDGTRGYMPDLCKALGLNGDHWRFLAGPGFVYLLRSRDQRPIGLLCLIEPTDRGLAPETGSFAMALATQAGVALENAQLSQQARALLARTQGLQQATNQIAAELDSERVLEGVMDSARRLLDADGYGLWAWYPNEKIWKSVGAHGLALASSPDGGPVESDLLTQVLSQRTATTVGDTAYSMIKDTTATSDNHLSEFDRPRNVRALLTLPLLYAGEATGVMVLYYGAPRTFVQDEVDLAQSFAHQAANALENARLFTELRAAYAREKRIAETLQRTLLPPVPERVGEFEFAHIYVAGSKEAEIGGDFFDMFELAPGQVGVVMADVTGKGLTAAVQTAMIKYTLRGFALEMPDDPALVLERVNNVLCDNVSNLDGFVTLFYGVLDVERGLLLYANAGHENPMLYDPRREEVRTLEGCDGLALGCLPGVTYEAKRIRMEAGQSILLYTDGVTEARDAGRHFLGVNGLKRMMSLGVQSAIPMANALYNRVDDYAGDGLRDDIALLLIRRVPSGK